jgi:hypothetical protein
VFLNQFVGLNIGLGVGQLVGVVGAHEGTWCGGAPGNVVAGLGQTPLIINMMVRLGCCIKYGSRTRKLLN